MRAVNAWSLSRPRRALTTIEQSLVDHVSRGERLDLAENEAVNAASMQLTRSNRDDPREGLSVDRGVDRHSRNSQRRVCVRGIHAKRWGLLLTHYGIRDLMTEAADQAELDPDRMSFMRALRVVRRQVSDQAAFSPSETAGSDPGSD